MRRQQGGELRGAICRQNSTASSLGDCLLLPLRAPSFFILPIKSILNNCNEPVKRPQTSARNGGT